MTQITALALSLAVECAAVWGAVGWVPFVRDASVRKAGAKRIVLACAAATLLSHPVAWWANGALRAWTFAPRAAVIEGAVVVFEAGVYVALASLRPRTAFVLSAAANAASFGVGLALWWLAR